MTIAKFQTLSKAETALNKATKAIKAKDFLALFLPLFKKFPLFQAVTWVQYTPRFNDGDPCRFRMGDITPLVGSDPDSPGGQSVDLDEYDDQALMDMSHSELDGLYDQKAIDAIPEFEDEFWKAAGMISEDLSLAVFGDSVQVVITRSGVRSDDYDCGY